MGVFDFWKKTFGEKPFLSPMLMCNVIYIKSVKEVFEIARKFKLILTGYLTQVKTYGIPTINAIL
jgi:hypothetical protein